MGVSCCGIAGLVGEGLVGEGSGVSLRVSGGVSNWLSSMSSMTRGSIDRAKSRQQKLPTTTVQFSSCG
jgi:hypothetical protein